MGHPPLNLLILFHTSLNPPRVIVQYSSFMNSGLHNCNIETTMGSLDFTPELEEVYMPLKIFIKNEKRNT